MNLYFPLITLALLSTTLPVEAKGTKHIESELQRTFRALHKTRAANPGAGVKLVDKINAERDIQRKAVQEKKAKDESEKKIKNWASKMRLGRFTPVEQKKLEEKLPEVIADFEEEQKLTRGTEDDICNKFSKMTFANLMNALQKKEKNKVLSRQVQKKLDLEKENKSATPLQYHYDKENFVFLSENKDSYYKKQFISEKQNYVLNKTELDKVYTILNIHEKSTVNKKYPAATAQARKDFLNLVNKKTGIMLFPTATAGRLNALVKVLRGPRQTVDYLFYNSQNLPGGLATDKRYVGLEQNHTLVSLNNKPYVFAVPHHGEEGTILSLSTKQVLNGSDMKEVNTLANSLWKPKILPQGIKAAAQVKASAPQVKASAPQGKASASPVNAAPQSKASTIRARASAPQGKASVSPVNAAPQSKASTIRARASAPQGKASVSPVNAAPQSKASTIRARASAPQGKASVSPVNAAPQSKASTIRARASAPQGKASASPVKASAPQSKASTIRARASAPQGKASASPVKASAPQSKASAPQSKASAPQSKASTIRARASAPQGKASVIRARASTSKSKASAARVRTSAAKKKGNLSLAQVRAAQRKKPANDHFRAKGRAEQRKRARLSRGTKKR